MAHYPDMDDDEEEWEDTPPPRRQRGPRFGPFITIAAAILVLFGAASRLGKPQTANGLFSLDLSASTRLEEERSRTEELRHKTVVTLGAVPTADSLRPRQPSMYNTHSQPAPVQPPYRGDFDPYAPLAPQQRSDGLRPPMSMPTRTGDVLENNYDRSGRFDPAPEAVPGATPAGTTYTVAAGDNWVKIAKATGKRWQDIQSANPASQGGLRVGMKLILP